MACGIIMSCVSECVYLLFLAVLMTKLSGCYICGVLCYCTQEYFSVAAHYHKMICFLLYITGECCVYADCSIRDFVYCNSGFQHIQKYL